jgi:hypothetical protein
VSGDQKVAERVLVASDDVSTSLDSLNAELRGLYPSLGELQKTTVKEMYSSLSSYLGGLALEANQIFQGITESTASFKIVEDIDGDISEELPGLIWTGSLSVV